jgi:hypothetical protein
MHRCLLLTLATGCDVGSVYDAQEIEQVALTHAQHWDSLPEIDAAPYPSAVGEFSVQIRVAGDVADYRRIQSDTLDRGVTVAVGTVIVREVLGEGGSVTKLTLMAKAGPGFDPAIGDWWFGVTDPSGVPLVVNGVSRTGHLQDCYGCHIPHVRDDYLFGVPATAM